MQIIFRSSKDPRFTVIYTGGRYVVRCGARVIAESAFKASAIMRATGEAARACGALTVTGET